MEPEAHNTKTPWETCKFAVCIETMEWLGQHIKQLPLELSLAFVKDVSVAVSVLDQPQQLEKRLTRCHPL